MLRLIKGGLPKRRGPSRMVGHVDGIRGTVIVGWAADESARDDILDIEIVEDGRSVGLWRADLPRDDLLALGYGHGRHGFALPLAEIATPSFSIYARRPGSLEGTKTLSMAQDVRIQIARAAMSAIPSVRLPDEIKDICRKVEQASFEKPDQDATLAESVYFSDSLLSKTMIAYLQ